MKQQKKMSLFQELIFVLYLCTIRTYRSLKSILVLLQEDAGEEIIHSLARTMYDNYLAINYVLDDLPS
jgi:hypothetical protein